MKIRHSLTTIWDSALGGFCLFWRGASRWATVESFVNQGVVRGVIEGGPDKDRREEKAIETLAIQSRETFLQNSSPITQESNHAGNLRKPRRQLIGIKLLRCKFSPSKCSNAPLLFSFHHVCSMQMLRASLQAPFDCL